MLQIRSRSKTLFSTAILLLFIFLLLGTHHLSNSTASAQQAGGPQPLSVGRDGQFATDQIMIKFVETADLSSLSQVEEELLMARLSRAAGVQLELVRPMSGGAYVLGLPQRAAADEALAISAALMAEPGVLLAEPDALNQVVGRDLNHNLAPDVAAGSPNDPRFADQWHYRYAPGSEEGVNLSPAWDITVGDSSVVVAVVDTGIRDHADLAGRTVPGYDFIGDLAYANDGDGRDPDPSDPGDWEPSGYCYGGSPARNSSWHGTHVSGTIGAATNNSQGVAGVNWRAKILPVRVLGPCGGYTSDVIDGVRWAAGFSVPGVPANNNAADVINLSIGGARPCLQSEQQAYNQVAAAGTTVVASAGNSNTDAANFSPASCDKVITVAATTRSGSRAFYSNYGSTVELSAPGGDSQGKVLSTSNSGATGPGQDSYDLKSGTSMAAPHVSGVASLLIGQHTGFSPAQVLQRLQAAARQFPAGSSCTTSLCGPGIVDAAQVLKSAPGPTPTPTSTPEPAALAPPVISAIQNGDGDGNFIVQWSAVPGAQSYKVKQNHDGTIWQTIYDGIGTSVARTNLPEGEYCYRVRAFNAQTVSDWSSNKCVNVSGPPTPTPTNTPQPGRLASPTLFDIANGDGDGNFTVQWSSVAEAEWYKVKQNHGGTTWQTVYEGPAQQFDRSDLPDGGYCYRARAFNAEMNSVWSVAKCTVVDSTPAVTSTPLPPSSFSYIPVAGASD